MYQINRTLRLNAIDEERVQVRFPEDDHVTIRFNADIMKKIVRVEASLEKSAWQQTFETFGVPSDHTSRLLDSLLGVGVIVEKHDLDADALASSLHARTAAIKFGIELPFINSVAVVGDGLLADWAYEAVENNRIDIADQENADFILICSDRELFADMRNRWRQTPTSRVKAYLWYDGALLRFGPLHIANETACFGCYLKRVDAASHFVDEALTYENANEIVEGGGGQILETPLDDLTRFVVHRAVTHMKMGQFDKFKPSFIHSWSALTGESSAARVLYNPYCNFCQKGAAVTRAVRDMT